MSVILQGARSPSCCRELWHEDVGWSALAFRPQGYSGVGAVVAVPARLQSPHRGMGWVGRGGCCCLSSARRNEGDDKRRGINPLRAQREIMREIWLQLRKRQPRGSRCLGLRWCIIEIYFYFLIYNCRWARGSVTHGKSSLSVGKKRYQI